MADDNNTEWPIEHLRWLTLTTVIFSACTLFFTVLSFWFIYVRRGHLESYEPHTFSFQMHPARGLRLRLPLVLYNTGALPIIIQNLRIRCFSEGRFKSLPWTTLPAQIKSSKDEPLSLPAVFSVGGRTAHQIFPEFGFRPWGDDFDDFDDFDFFFEARSYPTVIEVKLGHCEEWQFLLAFTLHAGQIDAPDGYITYENTFPSEERRQSAADALKKSAEEFRWYRVRVERDNPGGQSSAG